MIYGSESWLNNNFKTIRFEYDMLIRTLLGVRNNTSMVLCHIESGIKEIDILIKEKRKNYFMKKFTSLDMDTSLIQVYLICRHYNSRGYKFIHMCMNENIPNPIEKQKEIIYNCQNNATKFITYKNILNPDLTVYNIYSLSSKNYTGLQK